MDHERAETSEGGHMRLAAPILALPPEILAEIFVHCLPGSPDPQDAPYLLCHVCRQFREVAVSTPRLWSSLCVSFNDAKRYLDFCRNGVEIWLSRARSLPLSLTLSDDWDRDLFSYPHPEDTLLPAVIELSEQWRSLTLEGSFWANLLQSGSLSGKVSLLEELFITGYKDVILNEAPKLRVLSLDSYSHAEIQVPWHQLTTLDVRYVNISSCVKILHNSTNLSQASFTLYTTFDDEHSPLPAFNCRHARVRRLVLGVSGSNDRAIPLFLLGCLKTPALNDLTVTLGWLQPLRVAISPLLSFLSQPTLRLHTLALSLPHTTTMMEDLTECLKLAHYLVDFKFHCPYLTDIDILFVQLTGSVDFLPRLEHVHLVFSRNPPDLTTSVVEMLSWRWAALGITRLQSFELLHYAIYSSGGENLYGSQPTAFLDLLRSESEFRRLEGEGMLLAARETEDSDVSWLF
ncbi:hypothetical protein C8F04DRAFT_1095119 [Mycena alexandri]|uniref:F-box domain-containing protein n=1 Tax=Mycena alexandri TaxID=1745969 RepID=A0AAD6SZM9_9AGAR|nr:hypothetical protein C8F04DRAFT_1095119 [Mycena alexandri]